MCSWHVVDTIDLKLSEASAESESALILSWHLRRMYSICFSPRFSLIQVWRYGAYHAALPGFCLTQSGFSVADPSLGFQGSWLLQVLDLITVKKGVASKSTCYMRNLSKDIIVSDLYRRWDCIENSHMDIRAALR